MGGAGANGGGTIAGEGVGVMELRARRSPGGAVHDVTSTGTTPGLLAAAGVVGALAALVAGAAFVLRWPALATPLRLGLGLLLVWGAVSCWAAHRAYRLRVLLRRGFGLGAWLWLALSLAHEPAARAGGASGGRPPAADGLFGAAEALADPLALGMLWLCAVAWAVLRLVSRPPRAAGAQASPEASRPSIQK